MHKTKTAKETLADNLRLLVGGADSQRAREDLSKKSGVAPRTIGNMISRSSGNPTLANIEAVARSKGYSAADLLTENLGRSPRPKTENKQIDIQTPTALDNDEQSLIDGFRVADLTARETMLWLAARARRISNPGAAETGDFAPTPPIFTNPDIPALKDD